MKAGTIRITIDADARERLERSHRDAVIACRALAEAFNRIIPIFVDFGETLRKLELARRDASARRRAGIGDYRV